MSTMAFHAYHKISTHISEYLRDGLALLGIVMAIIYRDELPTQLMMYLMVRELGLQHRVYLVVKEVVLNFIVGLLDTIGEFIVALNASQHSSSPRSTDDFESSGPENSDSTSSSSGAGRHSESHGDRLRFGWRHLVNGVYLDGHNWANYQLVMGTKRCWPGLVEGLIGELEACDWNIKAVRERYLRLSQTLRVCDSLAEVQCAFACARLANLYESGLVEVLELKRPLETSSACSCSLSRGATQEVNASIVPAPVVPMVVKPQLQDTPRATTNTLQPRTPDAGFQWRKSSNLSKLRREQRRKHNLPKSQLINYAIPPPIVDDLGEESQTDRDASSSGVSADLSSTSLFDSNELTNSTLSSILTSAATDVSNDSMALQPQSSRIKEGLDVSATLSEPVDEKPHSREETARASNSLTPELKFHASIPVLSEELTSSAALKEEHDMEETELVTEASPARESQDLGDMNEKEIPNAVHSDLSPDNLQDVGTQLVAEEHETPLLETIESDASLDAPEPETAVTVREEAQATALQLPSPVKESEPRTADEDLKPPASQPQHMTVDAQEPDPNNQVPSGEDDGSDQEGTERLQVAQEVEMAPADRLDSAAATETNEAEQGITLPFDDADLPSSSPHAKPFSGTMMEVDDDVTSIYRAPRRTEFEYLRESSTSPPVWTMDDAIFEGQAPASSSPASPIFGPYMDMDLDAPNPPAFYDSTSSIAIGSDTETSPNWTSGPSDPSWQSSSEQPTSQSSLDIHADIAHAQTSTSSPPIDPWMEVNTQAPSSSVSSINLGPAIENSPNWTSGSSDPNWQNTSNDGPPSQSSLDILAAVAQAQTTPSSPPIDRSMEVDTQEPPPSLSASQGSLPSEMTQGSDELPIDEEDTTIHYSWMEDDEYEDNAAPQETSSESWSALKSEALGRKLGCIDALRYCPEEGCHGKVPSEILKEFLAATEAWVNAKAGLVPTDLNENIAAIFWGCKEMFFREDVQEVRLALFNTYTEPHQRATLASEEIPVLETCVAEIDDLLEITRREEWTIDGDGAGDSWGVGKGDEVGEAVGEAEVEAVDEDMDVNEFGAYEGQDDEWLEIVSAPEPVQPSTTSHNQSSSSLPLATSPPTPPTSNPSGTAATSGSGPTPTNLTLATSRNDGRPIVNRRRVLKLADAQPPAPLWSGSPAPPATGPARAERHVSFASPLTAPSPPLPHVPAPTAAPLSGPRQTAPPAPPSSHPSQPAPLITPGPAYTPVISFPPAPTPPNHQLSGPGWDAPPEPPAPRDAPRWYEAPAPHVTAGPEYSPVVSSDEEEVPLVVVPVKPEPKAKGPVKLRRDGPGFAPRRSSTPAAPGSTPAAPGSTTPRARPPAPAPARPILPLPRAARPPSVPSASSASASAGEASVPVRTEVVRGKGKGRAEEGVNYVDGVVVDPALM